MADPQKILQGKQTRRRIYLFIRDFIQREQIPPCIRDIQEGCDISSSSVVAYHLAALQKEELLTWKAGMDRTIVLYGMKVILPEVDERYA